MTVGKQMKAYEDNLYAYWCNQMQQNLEFQLNQCILKKTDGKPETRKSISTSQLPPITNRLSAGRVCSSSISDNKSYVHPELRKYYVFNVNLLFFLSFTTSMLDID